jgi:hypothetical protein
MVQLLRALLVGSAMVVLLATGSAAANEQIVPNGRTATAVTDRDGVTHMVYVIPNGSAYDTIGYCRIAKGAEACQDVKELTFTNLPCSPRAPSDPSDAAYDYSDNFNKPQVRLTPFGEVFVLWSAFCSHGAQTSNDMVVWSSTDDGATFANPHTLGFLNAEYPQSQFVSTWTDSVLDAGDRTLVSAISYNNCTSDPATSGGMFVQSAALGAYTSDRARVTPTSSNCAYEGGGGDHPTIVQRGKRSYAVSYVDQITAHVVVRTYDHPELQPSAVNDPANWSAAVDVTPGETLAFTDQPHLVSGPLGTFLLYRQYEYDPQSGQSTPSRWWIRRVTGTTLGAATVLPQIVQQEFNGSNRPDMFTGPASVVQDTANGRIHFARWIPGWYGTPNYVQYVTSDDGTTWTPSAYLPDPKDLGGGLRAKDLGGYDDFGRYAYDPVLAESTGINGFAGITGYSRGRSPGAYNGRIYWPFGVVQLPYRDAPPTPGDPGDPGNPGGGGSGGGGTGGGGTGGGTSTTPTPPPNPQDQRCKILQFAALDILADGCLTQEKGVFIARGGVSVNGLKIAGGELRFDPKELTVKSTGPVTVTVGATQLLKGVKLDWKLPKTNTFDLGALNVGALGSKLFGFGLKGDVDVKLVRGAVEIKSHLGMPGVLGGITADVTLRADNLAGLHMRELWVRFPSAKLGPLELADVEFNYNPEEDAWGGTLKLKLPPDPPGPALKANVGFKNGEITDLGGELTLPAPGIALDPFQVAWLTKIRASMHRPPLTLKGGITIAAGPPLDKVGSDRPITVDGDVTITLPDTGPSTFRADGVGSVMGVPIARAYLQFITTGQISAGGSVSAEFGPFSAKAAVDGWFYKKAFNIRGGADLCAGPVCIGGDMVFSSIGFAACADVGFTEIGAGINWSSDLVLGLINPFYLLTHIDAMPVGCDVGDYEAKAAAAQAAPGGERSVSFDAGLPSGFVSVTGQGAPPHVALVGPDGTRIEPTATTAVKTPGAFAFQSAKGNLTWFAIKAPKSGTWKIVPEADSVPIASVSKANGLPAPKVTASVKRTSGKSRVLSYKITPIPGQTVTFAEQGAKGIGAPLGKAKGSAGTLRFTPAPGPGGTRKIIAQVAQKGIPRKELTVARYVAPAPPKPARPTLKVKRVGTKLVVSWAKDGASKRWTARITLSDGRVLVLLPRKPIVTVAGVAKATTGRIAVYGEDAARVKGPTATATLHKTTKKRGSR